MPFSGRVGSKIGSWSAKRIAAICGVLLALSLFAPRARAEEQTPPRMSARIEAAQSATLQELTWRIANGQATQEDNNELVLRIAAHFQDVKGMAVDEARRMAGDWIKQEVPGAAGAFVGDCVAKSKLSAVEVAKDWAADALTDVWHEGTIDAAISVLQAKNRQFQADRMTAMDRMTAIKLLGSDRLLRKHQSIPRKRPNAPQPAPPAPPAPDPSFAMLTPQVTRGGEVRFRAKVYRGNVPGWDASLMHMFWVYIRNRAGGDLLGPLTECPRHVYGGPAAGATIATGGSVAFNPAGAVVWLDGEYRYAMPVDQPPGNYEIVFVTRKAPGYGAVYGTLAPGALAFPYRPEEEPVRNAVKTVGGGGDSATIDTGVLITNTTNALKGDPVVKNEAGTVIPARITLLTPRTASRLDWRIEMPRDAAPGACRVEVTTADGVFSDAFFYRPGDVGPDQLPEWAGGRPAVAGSTAGGGVVTGAAAGAGGQGTLALEISPEHLQAEDFAQVRIVFQDEIPEWVTANDIHFDLYCRDQLFSDLTGYQAALPVRIERGTPSVVTFGFSVPRDVGPESGPYLLKVHIGGIDMLPNGKIIDDSWVDVIEEPIKFDPPTRFGTSVPPSAVFGRTIAASNVRWALKSASVTQGEPFQVDCVIDVSDSFTKQTWIEIPPTNLTLSGHSERQNQDIFQKFISVNTQSTEVTNKEYTLHFSGEMPWEAETGPWNFDLQLATGGNAFLGSFAQFPGGSLEVKPSLLPWDEYLAHVPQYVRIYFLKDKFPAWMSNPTYFSDFFKGASVAVTPSSAEPGQNISIEVKLPKSLPPEIRADSLYVSIEAPDQRHGWPVPPGAFAAGTAKFTWKVAEWMGEQSIDSGIYQVHVGVRIPDNTLLGENNRGIQIATGDLTITTKPVPQPVAPVLTVTDVTPKKGVAGTPVTIRGAGFVPGVSTAFLGNVPLVDVKVYTQDRIDAKIPRSSGEGEAPIVVRSGADVSNNNVAFTVLPPFAPSQLQTIVDELIAAYEGKQIDKITQRLSSAGYVGVTEGGGNLNSALMLKSLQHDFELMSDIRLTGQVGYVGLGAGMPIVTLSWSVKYKYSVTGSEIEERDRTTYLAFRREDGEWLLVGQKGHPLFGRSDPMTGKLVSPEILAAETKFRLEEQARREAERFITPIGIDTKPVATWSADIFTQKVQAAADALVTSFEREDASTLIRNVSREYRGLNTLGGTVDYYTLSSSLQCDFQIYQDFKFSPSSEAFRVFPGPKQAELTLLWDARGRLENGGQDFIQRSRRTKLVFADENGDAKLIRQDVQSLNNGAVMFGQSDPTLCQAVIKTDEGSQTGAGTITVGGSSGSTGSVTTFSDAISLDSGTISTGGTVRQNQTVRGDIVIPAGVTVTVASGVIVTFNGNFQIEVYGTFNASGATFVGAKATPSLLNRIRWYSGSTGNFSSVTASNFAGPIVVSGGNVTASGLTLSGNDFGLVVTGGNLTVSGGTLTSNTNGFSSSNLDGGGTANLSGLTITGGTTGLNHTAGTLTASGGTMSGNSFAGVFISGGSATLSNVTCSNNSFAGVFISGGSATLSNVTCSNNSTGGGEGAIRIDAGTLSVTGGTLGPNGSNGIHVVGGNVTVSGATITGNTASGVTIDAASAGTLSLSSTTIQSNSGNGALISGGSLTMTGGSISANTLSGIDASLGGNIALTNVNITGNNTGGLGNGVIGNGTSATANGWFLNSNRLFSTTDTSTAVPVSTDPFPQYSGMTSVVSPRTTPN